MVTRMRCIRICFLLASSLVLLCLFSIACAESGYEEAYRSLLVKYEDRIQIRSYSAYGSVSLVDFYGDPDPELIFASYENRDGYESAILHAYTYSKGDVKQLDLRGSYYAPTFVSNGSTSKEGVFTWENNNVLLILVEDRGEQKLCVHYSIGDDYEDILTTVYSRNGIKLTPEFQLGHSYYAEWAAWDEQYDICTSNGNQISKSEYDRTLDSLLAKGTGVVFSMFELEDSRYQHFENYGLTWDEAMAKLGGEQDSSKESAFDEQVKRLGHYQLDLPDQGIELTLSCERHDFTQYAGSQSWECPMVYDLVSLSGNLPGIDGVNESIRQEYERQRASVLAGFDVYLKDYDYDPPNEYIDTVKLIPEDSYGDYKAGLQYYDGRYLSLLYDTVWYGGGTVVETNAYCMTFDLQTGEELSAADLFGNSQILRTKIKEAVKHEMRTGYGVAQLDADALSAIENLDLETRSFFLLRDGELVLCFDRYELGEGALGSPMIATGIRLGDSLASETDDKDANNQNGDTEEAVIYYADGSLKISDVLGNQSLDEYIVASKSTQYNPKLAYILSALSRSAYNKDHTDYLGRTLDSLGFTDKKPFNYGDDEGFASHYIAKKRLPDGRLLVVIVVRGTYNIPNFVSDIAATPSNLVTGFHSGFEESEMKVYKDLEGFLGSTIPTSNVIYVVTGHSLGAAVCNLLSVKLSDAGVPASCVFDYNFACPDVARGMGSRWNFFGEHNNMFNLADARDPVSYVPGVALDVVTWWNWTFTWGKYGRSYWFSYDWSNPDEVNLDLSFGVHDLGNYMYYFSLMNDTSNFKEWSGAKAAQTSANFDALVEQMKFF